MNYQQMTSPKDWACLWKRQHATCAETQKASSLFWVTKVPVLSFTARKKGITYCWECGEFPCDHLHPYADQAAIRQHNTKLFNLCLIKRMGVERWAEEKVLKVKQTYFQGKFSMHATDKIKS